ncbi:malonyl-coenzyme:anthocyanin 5-O-glucoside-6'''-O-malonyltransferase-like [Primulina eburnea]|uniref:malonyl-coenzyme:anthocyanin 5-O-glucoside-6'''-O-malonyltransferase-like n=1 Tax=Primulina eburnea TaxID=1245227 RepID=UPI003C6C8BAC
MTTQIESSQISPPHGEIQPEISFPLTYLDLPWLRFHPIQRLFFYDSTASKSSFLETHIPKLKQSLSLTLKHYIALVGNILFPLIPTEKPRYRYVVGDSVSLMVSESSNDFDSLVGYGVRDADQFYEYVPQMPPVKDEPGFKIIPVLAIKVTLFPGRGICIGIANSHGIGDGSSIVRFIKAWASTNKFEGSDEELLIQAGKYAPCLDRKFIRDPLGIDAIFWNEIRHIPVHSSTFPLPTKKVRATYILHEADIKKLKDLVISRIPRLVYLSSFVAASAYMWSKMVKSGDVIGEEVDESRDEYLVYSIDVRARVDPPVPENYFGNCVAAGVVKVGRGVLVGDEGFFLAAEAIGDDIQNRANNKEQVLKGVENWLSDFKKMLGGGFLGVSGSPKFDLYNMDFGWGKARKTEVASIDGENHSMSMCKPRNSDRGIEIGLSLPTQRMEAFAALFAHGLTQL